MQTDQGTVDSAKLNLAYCHIVSPIDGQVGLRQVDPGNYVQTSSATGIVVITQMQPISVVFSVPEDNLPDILQRMRAGATMSVDAYDRANVTQARDRAARDAGQPDRHDHRHGQTARDVRQPG